MRLVLCTGLLFALGAAAPVHDMRVQTPMKTVVGPASDLLFAVGGEVDPENGPSAAKVADARWQAAAEAATKIRTVSGTLLAKDRLRPGDWEVQAKKMSALSASAAKAASAKDGKALAAAANDLGDVCTACHATYKPQS